MSTLDQAHFRQPHKARKLLEAIRWPNGPVCPRCGSTSSHYLLRGASTRDGLWKCKDCRQQFSVTVGTVFERSKVSLDLWMQAIYLLCSSGKPTSVFQLMQKLGVTYKTAWYMTIRIREAMRSSGTTSAGAFSGKGKIEDTARHFSHLSQKRRARHR